MKRTTAILLALIVGFSAIFSGCADKSSDAYDKLQNSIANIPPVSAAQTDASKQEARKGLSGTLNISSYFDTQMLKRAEEFMTLNPNVQIEVKLADSQFENLDQYGLRMATELMSGKAADIVDMAHFATFKYAKSGLLCNLYEFMDSDPGFDKSDYYSNIFEAKEQDGKLYTMPFYFTYDMLYVSKTLTEPLGKEYTSFDYKKMLDLYNEVADKDDKGKPLFMPGVTKDFFFRYEFPAFYDTDSGVATFNSTEFIEYLERTDSIVTPFDPVKMEWDKTRIAGDDDFMKEDYLFCQLDVSTADTFNFLIAYKNILPPVPLKSSKGDELFLTLIAEYGISSNSKNREPAWEFIKFCIEEKEPPEGTDWETVTAYVRNYHGWVPINKNNFFHVFRKACEADLDMFGNKLEVEWKEGDRDALITEALEEMQQWNLARNRPQSETEIYHLIGFDLENFYYYDLSSAEESAAIIQAKMNAYLNE